MSYFGRKKRTAGAAVLALVLAAATGHAENGSTPPETVVDGVLHVQNGVDPARGTQTVFLEESWRAGGDTDSDTFFGLVTRVVADRAAPTRPLTPTNNR